MVTDAYQTWSLHAFHLIHVVHHCGSSVKSHNTCTKKLKPLLDWKNNCDNALVNSSLTTPLSLIKYQASPKLVRTFFASNLRLMDVSLFGGGNDENILRLDVG